MIQFIGGKMVRTKLDRIGTFVMGALAVIGILALIALLGYISTV